MKKRRRKPPKPPKKEKKPKVDHEIYPRPTAKGKILKFTAKHHHPPKGDHSCWAEGISRDIEFALFEHAEGPPFDDESGNLFNVYPVNGEYIELGTRHEQLAIFWKPRGNTEWHGHPRWPVKVSFASVSYTHLRAHET